MMLYSYSIQSITDDHGAGARFPLPFLPDSSLLFRLFCGLYTMQKHSKKPMLFYKKVLQYITMCGIIMTVERATFPGRGAPPRGACTEKGGH